MRRMLALGFIVLMGVASLVLVSETVTISVEQVEVPIIGLPAELDGVRIAQISDLHGRRLSPDGDVYSALEVNQPDLIAITGDIVDHPAQWDNCQPLLAALPELAPTFAVSGNHDYAAGWEWLAGQLASSGITVLENEWRECAVGQGRLILAGISDPLTQHHDLQTALPPDSASGPVILLAHGPTIFWRDYYLPGGSLRETRPGVRQLDWELLQRVDLTLAGHTHGGQIKLPLIGAVTTATGQLFPDNYVEGLSWEGSGWLYINRGLGTTGLNIRFLSRPEVTILTLRAK